tara:strand:+ start:682 stop:1074 length:393 start_codon:yes stop_codon:yes gene_type:complete
MKSIILILSVLLNTACSSVANSTDEVINEKETKPFMIETADSDDVKQALMLAIENKDYRLLVTSGRSMSIPGVKSSDYKAAIALCGKKYSPTTGDVITSEEQRMTRKKDVNFMRQYNEKMLTICQQSTLK